VQPPLNTLEVVQLTDCDDVQLEQRGKLLFEDGVRTGTSYNSGYQTVMEPVSLFWIPRPMFPDIDCQDHGWACCREDENDEFGYDVTSKSESIIFTVLREKQENVEMRRVPSSGVRGMRNLTSICGKPGFWRGTDVLMRC
jgi:hypothetical protein